MLTPPPPESKTRVRTSARRPRTERTLTDKGQRGVGTGVRAARQGATGEILEWLYTIGGGGGGGQTPYFPPCPQISQGERMKLTRGNMDLGYLWYTNLWVPDPPPPCVTFRLVVVSLRGPGRSPVLPFACCVGSLRSVGRCGRCSRWCRFRVRGAQ